MKIQTLFAAVLGLLLFSGLSLSQELESSATVAEETGLAESLSPEPLQAETISQGSYAMDTSDRRRSSMSRPSNGEMVMKIFELKYFPADDLERLIVDIFSVNPDKVHTDSRSNRIILQATEKQMYDIEALVQKLDIADSQLAVSQALENLVYRVYMFEIPSKDRDMKPFSMILQTPVQVSSTLLLDLAVERRIQISDFLIDDERDDKNNILIQGKALSNESVKEMVKSIPNAQIKELKWDDDETFTGSIGAAHYSQLPAPIQKHIQKFLGEDIVTVGYWFGSSSVRGDIEVPIGPWRLHLDMDPESDRTLELRIEVETLEKRSDFDRQLGRERSNEILSNTIQARVGRPIIVGYNRQSYGTRKMGAMVIIPETLQLNDSESTIR